MRNLSAEMSVAEVACLIPAAMDVFEAANIDYACRGARSLADAAADAGMSSAELLSRLTKAAVEDSGTDWWEAPLPDLIRFLVTDHQQFITRHLPACQRLLADARSTPESAQLPRVRRLFDDFASHTTAHMVNEERDLFPCIVELDAAMKGTAPPPALRIGQRVLGELVEHQAFHEKLRTIRELLPDVTGPFAAVSDALRDLTAAVHRHMHLENNVLYPRAMGMENELRR
jgi:regulator of cell morphogenesis and NO signaling